MASTTKIPPTLLTIPREIRDLINEFLLLENTMLFPYDYKPCACDCPKTDRKAPHINILRVNKQLHAEGNEVLYGRGVFVLTTGHNFMRFFNAEAPLCMHLYPSEDEMFGSRHLIGNIRLIVMPEFKPEGHQFSSIHNAWNDPEWQAMSTKQRRQFLHESDREANSMVWDNALCVLEELESLRRLILDIRSVFCPQGCCRMVNAIAAAAKVLGTKNISVAVLGQYYSGENAKVVGAINKGGVAEAEDLQEEDDYSGDEDVAMEDSGEDEDSAIDH